MHKTKKGGYVRHFPLVMLRHSSCFIWSLMVHHSCCFIWSLMVQCGGAPHLDLDYSYKVAQFKDPQCRESHLLQVMVTIVSANCFRSEISDTNIALMRSESFEPVGVDWYNVKTFQSPDCTGSIGTEALFEASKLWLGGGMDPNRSAVPPCSCVPAGMVEGLYFSASSWTPFGDLWWLRNGSAMWQAKVASTVVKCPWESECEDHGPWCTDAVLRLKQDGAVKCSLEAKCCGSCDLFFFVPKRVPNGLDRRNLSATAANFETPTSNGIDAPDKRIPLTLLDQGAHPSSRASLPTERTSTLAAPSAMTIKNEGYGTALSSLKDSTKRVRDAAEADSTCGGDKALGNDEKGFGVLREKMTSFPKGEMLIGKDELTDEGIDNKDARDRRIENDDGEWMWEKHKEEMVAKCKKLLERVSRDGCGFGPLPRVVLRKREIEFDLPEPHCHASICKRYGILRAANVCRPLLQGSSSPDGSIFIHDDTFARILIPAMCLHHPTSRGLLPTTSCGNLSSSSEERDVLEGDVMPLFERTCSAWALPAFTGRGFDETRLSHFTPSHMCADALCSLLQSAVNCVGFQNISFPLPSTRCPLLRVNQTSAEPTDFLKLIESREYLLGVVLITQFLPQRYGVPIALMCSFAPVELWPFAWNAGGLQPAVVLLAILLKKHVASVVGLGVVSTLGLALTIVLVWGVASHSTSGMRRVRGTWSKTVQGLVFMVLCWNDCEREHELSLLLASTLIVAILYFTTGISSDVLMPLSTAPASPLHAPKDVSLHPQACTPPAQLCECGYDTPASP